MGLANSAIRAATRFSEGGKEAEVVSATVSDLVTKVSRAMLMNKLKMAATMIIAVGALASVAVLAQDGAKVPEKPLPAMRSPRPGDIEQPGGGVLAMPGPPPGWKNQLIFAVIGKLSNELILECEDRGRIRATLTRGEAPC